MTSIHCQGNCSYCVVAEFCTEHGKPRKEKGGNS